MKIIIFFDILLLIISAIITMTINVLLFYLKTKLIEFEEVEEFEEADIVEEF
jgi:predicted membrane protein